MGHDFYWQSQRLSTDGGSTRVRTRFAIDWNEDGVADVADFGVLPAHFAYTVKGSSLRASLQGEVVADGRRVATVNGLGDPRGLRMTAATEPRFDEGLALPSLRVNARRSWLSSAWKGSADQAPAHVTAEGTRLGHGGLEGRFRVDAGEPVAGAQPGSVSVVLSDVRAENAAEHFAVGRLLLDAELTSRRAGETLRLGYALTAEDMAGASAGDPDPLQGVRSARLALAFDHLPAGLLDALSQLGAQPDGSAISASDRRALKQGIRGMHHPLTLQLEAAVDGDYRAALKGQAQLDAPPADLPLETDRDLQAMAARWLLPALSAQLDLDLPARLPDPAVTEMLAVFEQMGLLQASGEARYTAQLTLADQSLTLPNGETLPLRDLTALLAAFDS